MHIQTTTIAPVSDLDEWVEEARSCHGSTLDTDRYLSVENLVREERTSLSTVRRFMREARDHADPKIARFVKKEILPDGKRHRKLISRWYIRMRLRLSNIERRGSKIAQKGEGTTEFELYRTRLESKEKELERVEKLLTKNENENETLKEEIRQEREERKKERTTMDLHQMSSNRLIELLMSKRKPGLFSRLLGRKDDLSLKVGELLEQQKLEMMVLRHPPKFVDGDQEQAR